ncbi:MAG: SH3 domain-containing protein [Symploca sp. SIO2C1]|nr:SH3 domain-containing protein [Symploca sp. SIO2C1]
MSLSGVAQFIIGFFLGISLLVGAGVAAGYYFFTKLSDTPEKPIFPEEKPKPSPSAKTATSPKASPSPLDKKPAPTPTESPKKKLEPGAYKATVTWPEGLSLRDKPSANANRIGGIAYNQEIIILKDSDDKLWQKVRLPDTSQEGWVRAGNVKKVGE